MTAARKHWKGRPPEGAVDVLRLGDNGRWCADNGKPARAFSGTVGGTPYAWSSDCERCVDFNCPTRKAMDKTCERFRCANGRDMVRAASKEKKP